jgi:hypothetical protein
VFLAVVKRYLISSMAAAALLVTAAPASADYEELGVQPGALPAAACPENCEVLARVTGYQDRIDGWKNSYWPKERGRITAFTVGLGAPSSANIESFDDLFGESQARISILRLAKKKRRERRARLVAQSEVYDLSPYFGSSPTFALDQPLPVGRRHVVALTIPTWAPSFAVGLSRGNRWRAARDPEDCDNLEDPAVHEELRSVMQYKCSYRTARLVYSATFVPDPEPTAEEEAERRRNR